MFRALPTIGSAASAILPPRNGTEDVTVPSSSIRVLPPSDDETLDGVDVQRGAGDLQGDVALPGAVGGGGVPVLELRHLQAFADELPGDVRHPGGRDGPHGGGAEGAGRVAVDGEGFQGAADEFARVAQEVLIHENRGDAVDAVRKGGGCTQCHGGPPWGGTGRFGLQTSYGVCPAGSDS